LNFSKIVASREMIRKILNVVAAHTAGIRINVPPYVFYVYGGMP
jgi:hypothetical protein